MTWYPNKIHVDYVRGSVNRVLKLEHLITLTAE